MIFVCHFWKFLRDHKGFRIGLLLDWKEVFSCSTACTHHGSHKSFHSWREGTAAPPQTAAGAVGGRLCCTGCHAHTASSPPVLPWLPVASECPCLGSGWPRCPQQDTIEHGEKKQKVLRFVVCLGKWESCFICDIVKGAGGLPRALTCTGEGWI